MEKRVLIRLNSAREAMELVQQLSNMDDAFFIESRSGAHRVNAKSLLGVLYIMLGYHDGIYLVNDTKDGEIPACVEQFRAAHA